MILFDYSTSWAQEVPTRLLDGYCGYLMTDDYAGYNALGARAGVERLGCWAHARRKFVEAQKVQRADIALKLISKLYGIEIAFKESSDEGRKNGRQDLSLQVMRELKAWMEKTLPYMTTQNALGKAVTYLANNWSKLERYVERLPAHRQQYRRARDPAFRHRKEELVVQRYAQRRDGKCSTLQPGRDRQSQRPRALCVAAPRTGAPATSILGRRLRSPVAVELQAWTAQINAPPTFD
nr:transposase [Pseudomonas synxantha]